MLGKILKINKDLLIVENLKKVSLINIIGYYVVIESASKLVGEIVFVDNCVFHIVLKGEIIDNEFIAGVDVLPSINSVCRMINKDELELIIGSQNTLLPENLLLGKSNIYDGFNISVNINNLFSNHLAVIGNTGSGKSCGVARLFQNMFDSNKQSPLKSHIIIFDVFGEYKSALESINQQNGIKVKNYGTNTKSFEIEEEMIKIPPYLLTADDLALLLNINDAELINTLEKTLRYVYIFKGNEDVCNQYKNDIIAGTFMDILSSGKPAQQIRDQVLAFLGKFNTKELNIDTVVSEIGYNKSISQCLNLDNQGNMASLEILEEYLKKYANMNLDDVKIEPVYYTLDDLYYALEFAIISEGSFTSKSVNEKLNVLKTRLYTIMTSDKRKLFSYDKYVDCNQYVRNIFQNSLGESIQIVDVSFKDIDDRFAKVIVKILTKMFYKFALSLEEKGSFPINIVIEEAHRYIQKDNDVNVIGYNIFDRIAKEGRKYGVLLVLITQRISELSATVLSQCSNFMIFRMYYPEDIKIIASISSNISAEEIEDIKSLRPGSALAFGGAFKLPLIVHFLKPDPMPTSTSIDLCEMWYDN